MKYLPIILLSIITVTVATDNSSYSNSVSNEDNSKILSRRKRFIVFPDGSSFQMVFCAQNQGYLQVGDIVWFGNTAALAWELPTDPKLFYYLKDKKGYNAQRRNDNKHILYLDEMGKVVAKVPYRRKILVNPAFAKRSVTGDTPKENTNKKPVSIKKMHDKQLRRVLKMELENVSFHRESRKSLYDKLESFIEALGWKGQECVLRLLCESGQHQTKQGTFIEEITRAVFTLPPGQKVESPQHTIYDEAHRASDCHNTFPNCQSRSSKEALQ